MSSGHCVGPRYRDVSIGFGHGKGPWQRSSPRGDGRREEFAWGRSGSANEGLWAHLAVSVRAYWERSHRIGGLPVVCACVRTTAAESLSCSVQKKFADLGAGSSGARDKGGREHPWPTGGLWFCPPQDIRGGVRGLCGGNGGRNAPQEEG